MSFTTVSNVRITRDETDLFVAWTSASPEGQIFQVYQNGQLVWTGTDRRARLPYDGTSITRVDVGEVDDDEAHTNFSSSLPAAIGTGRTVTLTWKGGTYLDSSGLDDVAGFKIYGSATAGGAIDYGTVLATLPLSGSTEILDGFGMGTFGGGGFGRSDADYIWTSDQLSAGVWQFAVKPFDAAGNLGTGSTTSSTITAPPRPPAASSSGVRLTYTYNSSTRVPTLSWSASP